MAAAALLPARARKPEAAGNEDGELCPRPRELKSQRLHAPVGLEREVDVRLEVGAKRHGVAAAYLPAQSARAAEILARKAGCRFDDMQLKEAKEAFYDSSATLSENTRKLVFAGIAIIWILKVSDKNAGGIPFSSILFRPLFLFVWALGFDLLQYFYKTVSWWFYHKAKHQSGLAEDAMIDPPTALTLPTWFFFLAKLGCCVAAYIFVLGYIWKGLQQVHS